MDLYTNIIIRLLYIINMAPYTEINLSSLFPNCIQKPMTSLAGTSNSQNPDLKYYNPKLFAFL